LHAKVELDRQHYQQRGLISGEIFGDLQQSQEQPFAPLQTWDAAN
jgi:hypothetical protein